MEFAEVREYQPGDDVRTVDWNVTARMGHPFVKMFDEERELTVMLMVDASSSGEFGTVHQMKGEIAVELCALLAFSAIKNNDRVGLIIFTDEIERFVPPKKGRKHVLRVIRELLYTDEEEEGEKRSRRVVSGLFLRVLRLPLPTPRVPDSRPKTDISIALEYLNRVTTRKAIVFLVSDFMSEPYETALKIANRRHDVVAVAITDPRERKLPNVGLINLEDAETGEEILVDTSDPEVPRRFSEITDEDRKARDRLFRSVGVDCVDVTTDRPYVDPLMRFFRMRANRFR